MTCPSCGGTNVVVYSSGRCVCQSSMRHQPRGPQDLYDGRVCGEFYASAPSQPRFAYASAAPRSAPIPAPPPEPPPKKQRKPHGPQLALKPGVLRLAYRIGGRHPRPGWVEVLNRGVPITAQPTLSRDCGLFWGARP